MANVYQVYGNSSPVAPLAALMVDATAAALDGLRTVTINPISTLVRLQSRIQQRRQLRGLDDRMLADIGLTRKAADQEANKPFWKA